MGPYPRAVDLRVALLLGAAAALSACSVDDGDRHSDLQGHCEQEWSYHGYPEPGCEEILHAHLGIDAQDWDDEKRDLEYVTRGLWAFARAPIDLPQREARYDTVVSGIRTAEPGSSEIRLGHARLGVQEAVADGACAIIHEGRHPTYGPHDLEGRYDIGMDGPVGWCIDFAESFAKLEVDDGYAAYLVYRKQYRIR